ncbi:MAG: hypothetical protein ACR2QG_12010, partial [Gammaproteobacteria bacterium]
QAVNGQNQCSDAADDNTQEGSAANTGEVLKVELLVGPNYRIDELFFRNDGHNSDFDPNKTVGVSENGLAGAANWTNMTLDSNAAGAVIGASLIDFPAGGIIITAGEALYLAFTNQQFYLAGFSFTILNNQLNPVPLPAGLLLLLSGLMGLGFLGRYRRKAA